jgi:hypothetical protein
MVPEAVSTLRMAGVCVVDGVVDQGLVSALKSSAIYESMPTSSLPSRAQTRRRRPGPVEKQEEWRLSAPGRYHRREETFDKSDVRVFEKVEAALWPLVIAFFEDDTELGMQGIFRSEMQVCAVRRRATFHRTTAGRAPRSRGGAREELPRAAAQCALRGLDHVHHGAQGRRAVIWWKRRCARVRAPTPPTLHTANPINDRKPARGCLCPSVAWMAYRGGGSGFWRCRTFNVLTPSPPRRMAASALGRDAAEPSAAIRKADGSGAVGDCSAGGCTSKSRAPIRGGGLDPPRARATCWGGVVTPWAHPYLYFTM